MELNFCLLGPKHRWSSEPLFETGMDVQSDNTRSQYHISVGVSPQFNGKIFFNELLEKKTQIYMFGSQL
jgi:hypothetical protein